MFIKINYDGINKNQLKKSYQQKDWGLNHCWTINKVGNSNFDFAVLREKLFDIFVYMNR